MFTVIFIVKCRPIQSEAGITLGFDRQRILGKDRVYMWGGGVFEQLRTSHSHTSLGLGR